MDKQTTRVEDPAGVLSGRTTNRVGDHEETREAGDAFYLPPGHVPIGERVASPSSNRKLTFAFESIPGGGEMPGPIYEATWGRFFAFVYDAAFILAERRGLRNVRKDLVGRSKGRVVELGAGTGLNLDHYPEKVSELHLTEPDPHMAAKLRKRTPSLALDASVIEAPAESLPFDESSVDTVVSTLVLCTVKDPARALAEVARVLRPGGSLLFAEHVRSGSPRAARWQDRLNTPWSWYACGCQCNRDTVSKIESASFEVGETRSDRLRWISPVVRPLVVGSATPT